MKQLYSTALGLAMTMTAMANSASPAPKQLTPSDSIQIVARQYAQRMAQLKSDIAQSTSTINTLDNPYLFPVLTTSALYDFPLRQTLGTLGDAEAPTMTSEMASALTNVYAYHPELITYDLSNVAEEAQTNVPTAAEQPTTLIAPTAMPSSAIERMLQEPDEPELEVRKPNFWTYVGNFSFQFMQYYVSDNWYKGGENHNSFLAAVNLEANYDNKQKLTFSNKLEMRLGFQSSNTDTEHKYKTNTDLIRLTNKLGLQATKHWYYTVMLQSWTQFYPGYQANNAKVFSDFMSPFESVFSVGMDYKLKKTNFELVATLAPLAVNFKYVDRLALSTRYGVDEGSHTRFDFGSSVTIGSKWRIMKDVEWVSRLFAFTNYNRVQAEWENTFNFKVNKYLSAKLFLYPRFDDGVRRNAGESYFQFNEFLSVGFDYTF